MREATKRRTRRVLLTVLSFAAAATLIWALPYILDITWSEIIDAFENLTWWQLLGLIALWLVGLWSYTYMLKATLPGLTNLQAFTMNACSSGIGNMLPAGGAVGVAVNFALCRSWGYPRSAVAASVLVSGIWNTLIRLLVPALGLLALLLAGKVPSPAFQIPAGVAVLGLIGLAVVAFAALRWDQATEAVGRRLDWLGARIPRRFRPAPKRWSSALWRLRGQITDVIRGRWPRMTGWLLTYFTLQALLFAACAAVTGAYIGFAEAVAAFALGRLATAAPITPGGTGLTEVAAAGMLIALGAEAGPAGATALLFSALVFFAEIPLGAILWVVSTFLTRGRWAPERTAARVGFTPIGANSNDS